MKMTKISFWKRYLRYQPDDDKFCTSISCKNECPYYSNCEGLKMSKEIAEAYIKRHESKSKKKDHILDTTKKVTRPNFRKYLREKIDMKVRVTPELILELEKICKDEGVYHWNGHGFIEYGDNPYMLLLNGAEDCEYSVAFSYKDRENTTEYNPETDTLVDKVEEPKPIKTVGIDNSDVTLVLTAQYEPVKDCHVNSEYPDPIRVDIPDIFYCPTHQGILRFKRSHIILKDTNNEDCLLKYRDEYSCYRTLEEAVIVAKKLWNGEGK